jgi:hypothetical protein
MPLNFAWIETNAGVVYITSEKPFQKGVVLQELTGTLDQKVNDLSPFMVFSIEQPSGIPVTDSGSFLNLPPKIYFLNGKFYAREFIMAELCIIGNNQITSFERLLQGNFSDTPLSCHPEASPVVVRPSSKGRVGSYFSLPFRVRHRSDPPDPCTMFLKGVH